MKKKHGNRVWIYYTLKKTLRIMRIVLFLLLISVFQTIASVGYSQSAKITLKSSDLSLVDVLSRIEDQSEYRFIYDKSEIDLDKKVKVNYDGVTVKNVLEGLFVSNGINYQMINYQIILTNSASDILQQLKTISGKVTDSSGQPLPGVTVVVKGTTQGIITDTDGSYTLSKVPADATMMFSFVGMKTQEIPVAGKTTINIVMEEDVVGIEEVVAVGYGIQNRRDVSTSISSVKAESIENVPITDFRQALAGRMAGVQVMQTSGDPEGTVSIRVRGVKSVTAGNDPLYIIDGVPVEQGLEGLNSNDIESVEVLKDASSAAIYGSRGSNGVVIITTKRGKTESATVSYDGYYGLQQLSHKIPMLNAYQYAELVRDAHNAAYLDQVPTGSVDDPNEIRPKGYMRIPDDFLPYLNGEPGLADTDWQDEIFRTAPTISHNISISGKTKSTNYFISGGYYKQDGIIICSDFERYSLRVNLDGKKNKFKYGINFTPSYSHSNKVNASSSGSEGVVQTALNYMPTLPVYNPDGSYNFDGNGYYRIGTDYQINEMLNPVALANETDNKIDRYSILGKIYATYEIMKGLSFTTSLGGDFYATNQAYYRPSTLPVQGKKYYGLPSNPTAYDASRFYYNWQWENKISYNKNFGDHRLNTILVYSSEKSRTKQSKVEATDYANDFIRTISGGTVNDGSSDISEWSLASWLTRVQYSYKGKYMLSAAIRSDGSSRFGKDNRWGYFPSASAAWRLSDEDFIKDASFINDMKIRASYGQTGNFQIGNYEHLAGVSLEDYILGAGDGKKVSGYKPSSVENDDLGWEKTAMVNIGLDVSLYKGLLGFTVEWYDSKTSDMLLNVPVPHTTGYSTARMNIGEVSNKGWEITINSQKRIRDLCYSFSANIATNKNEVLKLGPGDAPIIATGSYSRAYYKTEVGEPIGNYFLLVQDGVFKTEEELNAYPHFSTTHVGDFRFVDVDGNETLDASEDRAIVGNYMPDFTYGFSGTFGYKNFDLVFAFQGVYGNEILNLNRRYLANITGNHNNTTEALNRWQSEENPGNGQINRANRKQTGYNSYTSTYHIEDGSYLRLQNIALGYTLPASVTKLIRIEKMRVYVSGKNLWTSTDYTGYNPEVNRRPGDALTPGEDYGTYPLAKVVTCGLNITF